jgi:hypothetical protein
MRAAPSPHETAPSTAPVMEGESGVAITAAPSQHKAAPPTASVMGGGRRNGAVSLYVGA